MNLQTNRNTYSRSCYNNRSYALEPFMGVWGVMTPHTPNHSQLRKS